MSRILSFLIILVLGVYLLGVFLAQPVSAAEPTEGYFDFNLWRGTGGEGGTCNVGRPCTVCDALVIVSNIITMFFKASLLIATIMIALGGLYAVIDQADPGKRKKGIEMMKNAGIGMGIILIAYPLIAIVLRILVHQGNIMPWAKITCR